MPRNRMIKPDFWNDEKLGMQSESVQLTFIALWNFADDYGVVRANHVWLKNQIFPYKESLRLDAFSKWLEVLERMGMLIKISIRAEQFYVIRTFRLHQSVEKPSKTRHGSEEEVTEAMKIKGFVKNESGSWVILPDYSGSVSGLVGDEDKLSISISKENRAKALVDLKSTTDKQISEIKSKYDDLSKTFSGLETKVIWISLRDFITENKPAFIEPYVDLWNILATRWNLARVEVLNDNRKKKFKVRLGESSFDFVKILEKLSRSAHLKGDNGSNWKASFDWIFENGSNYVKILEGNYD